MVRRSFSLFILGLILTACAAQASSGPAIRVEHAWARPTAANPTGGASAMPGLSASATPGMPGMGGDGATSAVYFVIVNDGGQADTLIGAACDAASIAEVHQTQIVNDIAEMAPAPRLVVPAHGKVEFAPGGYHVMLMGLTRDLKVGETLKLTLTFEKSGAITLAAPIQLEP